MNQTAAIAEPMSGSKLYQERARRALPILVRQAEAGQIIYYSDLAKELGMPNPRTLNFPLGSIGQTIERLGKAQNENIPPIQCLVVNKHSGLPGEGIGWFLVKKQEFRSLSRTKQQEIVNAELVRIFTYPRWREVLEALSLKYSPPDFSTKTNQAATFGGGEGESHRMLKEFIAKNPHIIGLKISTPEGNLEVSLASGDKLDVSFEDENMWTAAEVKPSSSPLPDITRGIFQCIKYVAVMKAIQASKGLEQNARAILVLESSLPNELIPLKNLLGVEVIANVKQQS